MRLVSVVSVFSLLSLSGRSNCFPSVPQPPLSLSNHGGPGAIQNVSHSVSPQPITELKSARENLFPKQRNSHVRGLETNSIYQYIGLPDYNRWKVVTDLSSSQKRPTHQVSSKLSDIVLDITLTELRTYLEVHNRSQFLLPDLDNSLAGGTVKFEARQGYFTNPETIERTGHSSMRHIPDTQTIEFQFSVTLKEMKVNYNWYKAYIIGIPVEGKVWVGIPDNEVVLSIDVTVLPECVIKIKEALISRLSGIQVSLTGLGFVDPLAAEIVASILSSYRSFLSSQIKIVLTEEIEKELAHTSICKAAQTSF